MLDLLYDGHPGITKMKMIARQIVWWPGKDAEVAEKVETCQQCQLVQKNPAVAPLHAWEWPKKPWSRIHIDHMGPVEGKTVLVVIDSYSKWIEAIPVSTTSSAVTIKVLRTLMAHYGLPDLIFSDNGTSFTSEEFQAFVKKNGIRHKTSVPYHPATNGLFERAVQVVKNGLRKNKGGDFDLRLTRALYHYRFNPHATTAASTSKLFLGRKLKTHMDLIHSDLSEKVLEKQRAQRAGHDWKVVERTYREGDAVYVRNYQLGDKWLRGKITSVLQTGHIL